MAAPSHCERHELNNVTAAELGGVLQEFYAEGYTVNVLPEGDGEFTVVATRCTTGAGALQTFATSDPMKSASRRPDKSRRVANKKKPK